MGLYFENNIFNNVLFDRPTRLATGLFFGDSYDPTGTASIPMPDGTIFTTFPDSTTLASLWGDAISVSAPYFAELLEHLPDQDQVSRRSRQRRICGQFSIGRPQRRSNISCRTSGQRARFR